MEIHKNDTRNFKPQCWQAVVNGTTTIVTAILKENAAKRLGVSINDVHSSNSINSHQTSVDEIVENFDGYKYGNPFFSYHIQMKQD